MEDISRERAPAGRAVASGAGDLRGLGIRASPLQKAFLVQVLDRFHDEVHKKMTALQMEVMRSGASDLSRQYEQKCQFEFSRSTSGCDRRRKVLSSRRQLRIIIASS